MSNHKDTYEAALVAAVAALDALCDTKHKAATGHDPDAADYDQQQHALDCATSNGVSEAFWLVRSMLENYRKAVAA